MQTKNEIASTRLFTCHGYVPGLIEPDCLRLQLSSATVYTHSDSDSLKPGKRRMATLIIFVMPWQSVVKHQQFQRKRFRVRSALSRSFDCCFTVTATCQRVAGWLPISEDTCHCLSTLTNCISF